MEHLMPRVLNEHMFPGPNPNCRENRYKVLIALKKRENERQSEEAAKKAELERLGREQRMKKQLQLQQHHRNMQRPVVSLREAFSLAAPICDDVDYILTPEQIEMARKEAIAINKKRKLLLADKEREGREQRENEKRLLQQQRERTKQQLLQPPAKMSLRDAYRLC